MACGNDVGRPSLQINMEDVEDMRKAGISITKISQALGVSRSTLYRSMEGSDLLGFTEISDQRLDELVIRYKQTHPFDGERMLIGYLRSQDIHLPRRRIRECIHRVDAGGVRSRSVKLIQRRTYYAKGANYVWHMDGNHKLVRWKFVIHGAVDGYSRLVTFLKCSTNNRASTVLDSFIAATQNFGLPKKLRTDLGGENVEAWDYMVSHHGDESCIITGSSVHNERIERMWRDVSRSVITPFKEIFVHMEDQEILDITNDVDLFCLHEVFTSRINASIDDFQQSWNSHPLTSENNQTPIQLFSLSATSDSSDSDDGTSTVTRQLPSAQQAVEVSNLSFTPCVCLHAQVKVIAAQPSSNLGCDLYEQVAHTVGNHITQGCNDCNFT